MIEKINHYGLTSPASVYDEEALTALELAGRTAAKANECIEAFNKLESDTGDKLEAQNAFIDKMNAVTMPAEVKAEVNRHIANGDFDAAISIYLGNLNERLTNLLGTVKQGSTTMDAELIDTRLMVDGSPLSTSGEAIREQSYLYPLTFNNYGVAFDRVVKGITYTAGNTEGISNEWYTTYEKNVSYGERYLVTTEVVNSDGFYAALVYNSAGSVIAKYGGYSDGVREVQDLAVLIPKDGKLLRICPPTTSGVPTIKKSEKLTTNISDAIYQTKQNAREIRNLINSIGRYAPIDFDEIQPDTHYITGEGTTFSGLTSYVKYVTEGDVYSLKSRVIPNTNYSVALFCRDNGLVETYQRYESGETVMSEHLLTIPHNVNKLIVVAYSYETPSLFKRYVEPIAHTPPQNIAIMNYGYVTIKSKYSDEYDLAIEIGKNSNNNLIDFRKVYLVANTGELNADTTPAKYLIEEVGDMLGPHIVKANQNEDGDHPTNEYFTGGAHLTNNLTTGAAPTALNTTFRVKADNRELNPNDIVYCDNIRIDVYNYIQAYNTTKDDGTGRSVMTESVRFNIKNGRVEIDITHLARENITRKRYYGLQIMSKSFKTFKYIEREARGKTAWATRTTSNGVDCRTMIFNTADNDEVEMGLYDIGLGNFSHITSYSAFSAEYNKAYFNIIADKYLTMENGSETTIRGYYEFRKGV